MLLKNNSRHLQNALTVSLCLGSEFANSRYCLLSGRAQSSPNSLQPETVSSYLMSGDSLHLFNGNGLEVDTRRGVTQATGKQQEEALRIFVTGATGFIGTELVQELIEAGHQVRGLARSDAGVEQLKAAGVEAQRGDLEDLESLRTGSSGMDVVVNLAFNHDFAKFAQNGADEIKAIQAMGSVLEPGKLLLVTSGIGLTAGAPGQVRVETDPAIDLPSIPRKPEQAARAVAERGVHVGIVRLPQVHDTRKQGLITYLLQIARDKGLSAYIGDGAARWSAAPLKDVAHLYRLAVEKTGPGVTTYHAVQEEGVPLRDIAETLGKGLKVPVVSLPAEKAAEHFGMFGHFATLDMPAASEWTRKTLDWNPTGSGLIEDLTNMNY